MKYLYYSKVSKECDNIILFIKKNMLDNILEFICIDNRYTDENGVVYCILNKKKVPLSSEIKYVPTLQVFSINTKFDLYEGEQNIKEYLNENVNKNIKQATNSNMEPMSYNSFMSNQYSGINENYGDGFDPYYDSLNDQFNPLGPKDIKVKEVNQDEMVKRAEKMKEERERDIRQTFGTKPLDINFSYR